MTEDDIEAAYWNFDARRSGYGEWKQAPMSERDAFKTELRIAVGKIRLDTMEVLKTIAEMNPYDTSSMEYVVSLAKGAVEKVTGDAV